MTNISAFKTFFLIKPKLLHFTIKKIWFLLIEC